VYGSGTNAHNVDFLQAADALRHVLLRYENVRLRIVGTLELPNELKPLIHKIERHPFSSYLDYLSLLSQCDINIAPLAPGPFNDAKSNIKFLEASVLAVPSVCSPRDAFQSVVKSGENGFLCDSSQEWLAALEALVADAALRKRIGDAAEATVSVRYASERIAQEQLSLLVPRRAEVGQKKRILVVNIYYSPRSFGGATIVAEEVNKCIQAAADYEVFVVTSLPEGVAEPYSIRRYEAKGVAVFGIALPRVNDPSREFEDESVRAPFREVCAAVDPDIVHFHSVQGIGVAPFEVCKDRGVPYVVSLHDTWWLCGRHLMIDRSKRFCGQETIDAKVCARCVDDEELNQHRQKKLSQVLNEARMLLVPSRYFANLYAANGFASERILLNTNGIQAPKDLVKRRRDGALVFGFVGGDSEIKGFALVKRAFSRLASIESKLILVDNTAALGMSAFEDLSWSDSERIEVVPNYTQDSIDAFFEKIDVLLFPSQVKESFGLTVREALARNVWVICTDAGAVTEVVRHGQNGFIVPFDDTGEQLAHAMREVITIYSRYSPGDEIRLPPLSLQSFSEQAAQIRDLYRFILTAERDAERPSHSAGAG
jgi:glycosyltransferase involved in cell wall biosynthesis